jgi:hypothetical protein
MKKQKQQVQVISHNGALGGHPLRNDQEAHNSMSTAATAWMRYQPSSQAISDYNTMRIDDDFRQFIELVGEESDDTTKKDPAILTTRPPTIMWGYGEFAGSWVLFSLEWGRSTRREAGKWRAGRQAGRQAGLWPAGARMAPCTSSISLQKLITTTSYPFFYVRHFTPRTRVANH